MPRSTIVRIQAAFTALAIGMGIAVGCAAVGAYACGDDAQCVGDAGQGTCEAEGYCAFPDDTCPTGKRFGEHAGDGLAGSCAGGATGPGTTEASTSASTTGSGSTDTVSGTTGSICGDGSIDGDEACDDGNQADGDGCSSACQHEPLRVFATSEVLDGKLGGLAGADALCQQLADGASLGGTWMAWLSDGEQGPAARFTTKGGPRPYHRVDGTAIAGDWADLIDGQLAAPISLDEAGNDAPGNVWTNTAIDGTPTDAHCDQWTTGTGGASGNRGHTNATDVQWTDADTKGCQNSARLYCVEQ